MDQGDIIESVTLESLLAKDGFYESLCDSKFAKS